MVRHSWEVPMTARPGGEQLHGPGRWLVTTETSTYVLELDEMGTGSLVRHAGEGVGPAPETTELPPPISVNLRRDAEHIPVMWAGAPVVGQPWALLLDLRGDGISTIRITNIVRQIVADPIL